MYHKSKQSAFTLIELLVVIAIITLLISILLPALSAARTASQEMVNNSQLRGIMQGMVIYAQTNNSWFPGIDGSTGKNKYAANSNFNGKDYKPHWIRSTDDEYGAPDVRCVIMLNAHLLTPKYLISSGETSPDITPVAASTGNDTQFAHGDPNCSYAFLYIKKSYIGTHAAWRDNMNSQAVMLSDRAKGIWTNGTSYHLNTTSIWVSSTASISNANSDSNNINASQWAGGVAFGDGHVKFYNDARVGSTQYSGISFPINALNDYKGDNIFSYSKGLGQPNNFYQACMVFNHL